MKRGAKKGRQFLMWTFIIAAFGFVLYSTFYNQSTTIGLYASSVLPPSSPPNSGSIFGSEGGMAEAEIDESKELENLNEEFQKSQFPPVQIKTYRAKKGDNLWKISGDHELDWYTVLSVNKLKNANDIKIGQKLKIPNQRGILHSIKSGETLEDIAIKYNVSMSRIVGANRIVDPEQIHSGVEIFIPKAKTTLKEQKELVKSRGIEPLDKSAFLRPTGGRVTSRFGYRIHPISRRRSFHRGVDLAAPYGSPIRAAAGGQVTFSGRMGGYGKLVVINHAGGWVTRYAHNSKLCIGKGQWVKKGKVIALAGATGRAKGTHLHFEIWKNGEVQNPLKYITR